MLFAPGGRNMTEYAKRGYLLENFRLFHLHTPQGAKVDYHYHDFYKILFFRSGAGDYIVEGQRYRLQPGDIVIFTDVNGAEANESVAMKVNAEAPGILAEAAREAGALLMHISTDYVFDGKGNVPYDEDAQPSPVNAYGRTKLEGEMAIVA